jgi:hypothetical protein
VRFWNGCQCLVQQSHVSIGDIQSACRSRYNGIKEKLKHIERELKKLSPDLKKVGAIVAVTPETTDPKRRLKLHIRTFLHKSRHSNL